MTGRLRELAEQMGRAEYWNVQEAYAEIKAWRVQLLSILDAEGDGGATGGMSLFTGTIGGVHVGLHGTKESIEALDAFLAAHPARSGGVSDADVEDAARYRWLRISACEIAWNEWCSYAPGYSANGPEELDQAIDAARKGERHE